MLGILREILTILFLLDFHFFDFFSTYKLIRAYVLNERMHVHLTFSKCFHTIFFISNLAVASYVVTVQLGLNEGVLRGSTSVMDWWLLHLYHDWLLSIYLCMCFILNRYTYFPHISGRGMGRGSGMEGECYKETLKESFDIFIEVWIETFFPFFTGDIGNFSGFSGFFLHNLGILGFFGFFQDF